MLFVFAVATFSSSSEVTGGDAMTKQDLTVELFYNSAWNAIPAYVSTPVRITRERPAGSEPTPFTARVTLEGIWNPKNPLSPLYGLAGQNTPIRFTLDTDTRFYGEVASWAPRRSLNYDAATGRGKAETEVTANGILRRLGQGADPLHSALYRAVTLDGTALGHWPMEDPARSTQARNTVEGGAPASPVTEVRYTTADGTDIPPGGSPDFAAGLGPAGTDNLVDMTSGGTLEALVPAGGTGWTMEFVFRFPLGTADGSTSLDIFEWNESGTYDRFTVNVTEAGITVWHEIDGSIEGGADATFAVFDGVAHHFRYTTSQSGGNYQSRLYIDGNLMDTADNFGSAMTGTIGRVTSWTLNPLEARGDTMPTAFGHVTVWPSATVPVDTVEAAFGWVGELAAVRAFRLCTEEGISLTIVGDIGETQAMGPQLVETLPKLFAEIERTDGGLLYEPRDDYGLVYRTGRDMYNQTPALELDWSTGHVAPPLLPVLDDLESRNDVTVTSSTGGTARAVLETGPLSVQAPPDGIGRYTTHIDVNPADDGGQLTDLAWWYLHKGTIDGIRYARVTVDLVASPSRITQASAVDIGDIIVINNLPADESPTPVQLQVLGYTEVIESHRRVITYICVPVSAQDIGVWGSDSQGSRYGASNTVLAEDLTDVETAADVTATGEVWATTASHPSVFPFDVTIGGLVYSCTAITGATPNYTLTLVRLATDKAHSTGDAVTVTDTGRYGL